MIRIFKLTIYSKHKNFLKKFYNFLIQKLTNLNTNILKKSSIKKSHIKKISLLKSPHVHKKAQEQFEIKTHLKNLTLYTTNNFKLLIFLKKIENILSYDVKIKTEILTYKKIKIDDLKINKYNIFKTLKENKKIFLNKNIKTYEVKKILNFIDFKGESYLLQSLDSSAGRAKD